MKLYLGLAGPLLLYIYLPLVLIGLFFVWRKCQSTKARVAVLPIYLVLAYVIPLGDVTVHSWNMAKVCPKAGLHVYRTVVVDGYMPGGEFDVKNYGYLFAESLPDSTTGLVTRWERRGNEVLRMDKVQAQSEWKLVGGMAHPDPKFGVSVSTEEIVSSDGSEILADRVHLSAWKGWIDAAIGSLIDNPVGGCSGNGPPILRAHLTKILIPAGAMK